MTADDTEFRRLRVCFPAHAKHEDLDALQVHILLAQVMPENPEGILRRSPEQMAAEASSRRMIVTVQDVRNALFDLQEKGVIQWWPELQTVWWIEAADEQTKHQKRPDFGWKSILKRLVKQKSLIQNAFYARYADHLPDRPASEPESDVGQMSFFGQNRGHSQTGIGLGLEQDAKSLARFYPENAEGGVPAGQNENSDSGSAQSPNAKASTARVSRKFCDEVIAMMQRACRSLTGKPHGGPHMNENNRKLVRKATKREGATLEQWQEAIDAQLENVKRNGEWKWLNLETIHRSGYWRRLEAPRNPNPNPTRGARRMSHSFSGERTGGFGQHNGPSPERIAELDSAHDDFFDDVPDSAASTLHFDQAGKGSNVH